MKIPVDELSKFRQADLPFPGSDLKGEKGEVDLLEILRSGVFPTHFFAWIRDTKNSGALEQILFVIKQREGINDDLEALKFIYRNVEKELGHISIVSGDFQKKPPAAVGRLRRKVSREKLKNEVSSSLYWKLGLLGHQAFQSFLTSREFRLINGSTFGEPKDRQMFLEFEEREPQLFEARDISFIPKGAPFGLKEELSKWEDLNWGLPLLFPEQIEDKQRGEIFSLWQELGKFVSTPGQWIKNFQEADRLFKELAWLLTPIFRPFLWKMLVLPEDDLKWRYLKILTTLTWANIAISCSNSFHAVSEIPLLSRGDPSRRVDVLQFSGVNIRDLYNIKLLKSGNGKPTLGKILNQIQDNPPRVLELKFAVGDAPLGEILSDQDGLPLGPHVDQVQYYESFSPVDLWLANGGKGQIDWSLGVSGSSIVYCLPFSEGLVVVNSQMAPKAKMSYCENLADGLPYAEVQAFIRHTSNVVNQLIEKGLKRTKTLFLPQEKSQLLLDFPLRQGLFSFISEKKGVKDLLAEARTNGVHQYADEHGVIEIVNWVDREPVYVLDLEKLSPLIKSGQVKIGYFSSRGGHIQCLIHNDPSPSMYLYMDEGVFHCFGCGAHGRLKGTTFSVNGASIAVNHSGVYRPKSIEEVEVPPGHHFVMALANRLLWENFKRSAGERYIRDERLLNPDVAHNLGIGFGDDKVAIRILEKLSYDSLSDSPKERILVAFDKMVAYGFVSFFESEIIRGRFVSLLKSVLIKAGLALDDIVKEIGEKDDKPVFRVPYFTLTNRITAPTGFGEGFGEEGFGEGEVIYSLYGRAVGKARKHHKLTFRQQGIPQGGFRVRLARDPTVKELFITEGVIDALSLDEMGYPALALIGADNITLINSIAELFKGDKIFIAMDFDQKTQTGQKNTIKIASRLESQGFKGEIIDFTCEFINQHPDFVEAGKDFNDWIRYLKTKK